MKNLKLPELNTQELTEKAREYAMKGAIQEIQEFYSGYSSPFRKAIREYLESKTTSIHLELPDIVGLINEALSQEIDKIANNSIAETFIPLAKDALTRIKGDVKFSDLLKTFLNSCKEDFKDNYRPELSVEESGHRWLDVSIEYEDYAGATIEYKLTLHKDFDGSGKYRIFSLPRTEVPYNYTKMMKLSNGDATIEMPFMRDTLKDSFTSYIARIILSETLIEMDCNDFEEEMFEEED